MDGYLAGILAIFAVNVVLAYAVYLPAAAGMLNLGIAGFMAVGAYTSATLDAKAGAPLWVCISVAMVVSAVVGFLVAFPILRTRGVYLVLATFAFGEVVSGVIINLDVIGGATGLPVTTPLGLAPIAIITVVATIAVFAFMSTRVGMAMRSIHDDEAVAALFGINVRLTKVAAFTLGAGLAGLAGALYAHHYNYIEVGTFDLTLSLYTLLFVLLGGTQTPFGPLAGAAVFSLLPEVLRSSAQWRYVVFAVLIIAVMAWRPEGLITRAWLLRLTRRRAPAAMP
jgi:branched-chain amino acid transport system permease protein